MNTESHFWQQLYDRVKAGGLPITALAPMADVTDRAYRQMVLKYSQRGSSVNGAPGGPDVLWTEFVSCDGLCSRGRPQLLRDLQYTTNESPLIAQIFGSHPDKFRETAELVVSLGFDGIDINMGCPDQTINRQGAGACLIQTPELARQCITATIAGAGSVPVSVKTRIGWSRDESPTWIPSLLDTGIAALTIHARTRREMSDYPPHWDVLANIVQMAEPYQIPVIANGGIMSLEEGTEVCHQTGAHGYMVGKATFGNPWFFDLVSQLRLPGHMLTPDMIREKLVVAREHTLLYDRWVHAPVGPDCEQTHFTFGEHQMLCPEMVKGKSMNLMKKNFRCYINGFDHAKELRLRLMDADTTEEIVAILDEAITLFR